MATSRDGIPMKFGAIRQADLPTGRNGRHKEIVELLLNDIAQLEFGEALKVPLAELPDTKLNIRSALIRATQQRGISIATSSDKEHLYIWKPEETIKLLKQPIKEVTRKDRAV